MTTPYRLHGARLHGEHDQLHHNDRAVIRGRDAAARIADTVLEWRARGRIPLQVRVSEHTAKALVAYFSSIARYVGGYPRQVHGVPLLVVVGQVDDVEMVLDPPDGREKLADYCKQTGRTYEDVMTEHAQDMRELHDAGLVAQTKREH